MSRRDDLVQFLGQIRDLSKKARAFNIPAIERSLKQAQSLLGHELESMQDTENNVVDLKPASGSIIQLAYTSHATIDFDEDSLTTLLRQARKINGELGITGLLIFGDDAFFQVLEGNADSVIALFNQIRIDQRHQEVREIYRRNVQNRSFTTWRMGFRRLKPKWKRKDFFRLTRALLEQELSKSSNSRDLKKLIRQFYLEISSQDEECALSA